MITQRSSEVARHVFSFFAKHSRRETLRKSQALYSTIEANDKEPENTDIKEAAENENPAENEIKKLNETISELTEKYKRSLAETENVRMRLRKEISDAKIFGIQSFCKDLLTVADVMQMAISSIPADKLETETDKVWTSFYKGVSMTEQELHNVFERHGLVVVKPEKGDKFDPNEHEALFESPVEGMDPGMIAHVQRTGYKLKGRTIRPAQVGVSGKQS